jgi:3-demethoxyubiquinol 3-hydroxylase
MSRRGPVDALVVGGGVVGAACALAMARRGLDVSLVEAAVPADWQDARPDLRVYALAPDNVALLDALGAWAPVRAARAHPYRRMRVWDAAGGGELRFDADAFGRAELGWIVEHGLLVDRLWAAMAQAGVRIHCPARVAALEQDDDRASVLLDDGSRVTARVAIAADGANSTVRDLAGIAVSEHDYGQRALVAYVRTGRSHQDTAWQRFLPGGPLAFLPCADGSSSIVWTLPEAEAQRTLALDDEGLAHALTEALARRLGAVEPISSRAAFPLRRRLAEVHVRGRVLLLGDAAHVVHPLAGQGVNIGLRDVSALVASIDAARSRRLDWTSASRLQRWGRARHSEGAVAAHAFEAINLAFSNQALWATALRGPLLGLAGRLPPLTHALWRRAAGI